jgi:hypothetical protein
MNADARNFPQGYVRVSDAERDRALSELSKAYQAGRITADEFDQRSEQALGARTGQELIALLADLPIERLPASTAGPDNAAVRRMEGYLASRLTIGASLTAICFGAIAALNVSGSAAAAASTGVLIPAVVAALCVALVVTLRIRARRASQARRD